MKTSKTILDQVDRARPRPAVNAVALYNEALKKVLKQRSDAYKAGVLAMLNYRFKYGILDDGDVPCEYPKGSAERDAFYYGAKEGKVIYREHLRTRE